MPALEPLEPRLSPGLLPPLHLARAHLPIVTRPPDLTVTVLPSWPAGQPGYDAPLFLPLSNPRGQLPPGLALEGGEGIVGTPTTPGRYVIIFEALPYLEEYIITIT